MMDGYSVPETASVLGVPEGKVWELLARGVLSGAPEGDGMRVFLKDTPAPMSSHGDRFASPPSNGGGASVPADATPFRELLTEFRNLTERYGQALLALGEARGEVAGLRSRVDLLEARLDLRLPGPGIVPPVAWERPAPRDEMAEPESEPEREPESPQDVPKASAPVEAPIKRATPRRRSRTARSAVAGFADALARAQDPTTAEMPSVADVANHVAEAAAGAPEGVLEEIANEPAVPPVNEELGDTPATPATPSYSTDVIEPDWFADGDFAWLDAAEIEAQVAATSGEPEPQAFEPESQAFEPEPPDAQPEASHFASDSGLAHDPTQSASDFADPRMDPVPTAIALEPAPEPDFTPAPESGLPEVLDRASEFTVQGADPFHIGIADVPSDPAPEWRRAPEVGPETRDSTDDPPEARPETGSESMQTMVDEMEVASSAWREPVVAVTQADPVEDESLARLARQEGWDAAEVEAIRALVGQGAPGEIVLPGADDLDEAIAALNAGRPAASAVEPSVESWMNAGNRTPGRAPEPTLRQAVFTPPPTARPMSARRTSGDPSWLRGRRGPAATAFRRLRRLFTE